MTTPKPGQAPEPGRYIRPADIDNRATPGQHVLWSLEAFAWDWVYWKPMKLMGIESASGAGASILRALGPLSAAHRTATRNLRLAFPDWSLKEVDRVAREAWANLGCLAGELPHLSKMRSGLGDNRVEVVNGERLDALRESGRPAVLIGGHFANWEMLAWTICNRPLDAQITYRAANNPHIDRRISQARVDYGIQVLTPKGPGTRELMRALGRGQSVGLMNDQKFNQGIPVPFFGHDAMTAPGPTRLAMKFGCPLIPIAVKRTGKARYRVTVHEPFFPDAGPDETAAIHSTVLGINRLFEDWIREAPEQWFWMHNRWPKEAWVRAGVM
ncbi:MAG: lysophospholipid acyltransferase family protein [Alphaproteobacteria bacterium]|nr:lysophospholipid acyltransferase family protein [Alphaproteobacteria bacterium]